MERSVPPLILILPPPFMLALTAGLVIQMYGEICVCRYGARKGHAEPYLLLTKKICDFVIHKKLFIVAKAANYSGYQNTAMKNGLLTYHILFIIRDI